MDPAHKDSPSAVQTSAVSIMALVLGGATFLLAFFAARPATVAPLALVGLALVALIPLLTDWKRATPFANSAKPWRRFASLTTATALGAAGFTIWALPQEVENPEAKPTPSASTPSTPTPSASAPVVPAKVAMIQPAGSSSTPVPGCFTVRFSGVPAAGYSYAVAHSTDIDPRYYFAGRLKPEKNDVWAIVVRVGTDTAGLDETFHFSIVMIKTAWVDYLIRTTVPTQQEPNPTWWSSSAGLPPESFLVGQFDIHRDTVPNPDCPVL